jgi:hypothetical protein
VVGGTLPQAFSAYSARTARGTLTLEERDESESLMADPLAEKINDIRDDKKQAVRQLTTLVGLSSRRYGIAGASS